jgi:hypothetical protein
MLFADFRESTQVTVGAKALPSLSIGVIESLAVVTTTPTIASEQPVHAIRCLWAWEDILHTLY